MLVLEVGFKLNKDLKSYQEILKNPNVVNCWNCEIHDIYYKQEDNLSANEMKNSCIRLRLTKILNGTTQSYRFQNFNLYCSKYKNSFHTEDSFNANKFTYKYYLKKLERKGLKKIFDTYKVDYQYSIGNMKSRIQLQDIKDIGLLLYYDNPDLYELSLEEQRKKLIDELNNYGFDFKYSDLGLDKLRTLYYKKEMYSKNQNS